MSIAKYLYEWIAMGMSSEGDGLGLAEDDDGDGAEDDDGGFDVFWF